jgi:hypothetical protein
VGDERLCERAAVLRLQDRRLDLDEAVGVEVRADRRDHARADERVTARILIHQQVEVTLAVALLGVGQPVERIRQRTPILAQEKELLDGDRGLPPPRLRRGTGHADDIAEGDVDHAAPRRVAEQLDPPAAVDQIEKDQLAHLAPPEHPAGHTDGRVGLGSGLELLGFGSHGLERHRVGKALRRHRRSLRRKPRRLRISRGRGSDPPSTIALGTCSVSHWPTASSSTACDASRRQAPSSSPGTMWAWRSIKP